MERICTADFFVGNRDRLKTLFPGTAPIVVTAHGALQRNGDVTYSFRQDANFWYLTGIELPNIILVMDRDKEYLIVPEREKVIEAFDGFIDHEVLSKISGVKKVYDAATGWKQLTTRLKRAKHVATMAASPLFVEPYGFYTNPARLALTKKITCIHPGIEILDLRTHLQKMRMVKQEPELRALQAAIDITAGALRETTSRGKVSSYKYEFELRAALEHGFGKRGSRCSFETIVASGANACVIHNVASKDRLAKDSLVVIDAGAEVENYAADISRTVPTGKVKRRQQKVYDAVLDAQLYAIRLMKPGSLVKENEKLVEQYMGEKLRELGLIKTIDHDSVREYFPHATSHFLGLDVHDVGDYELPLAAGMVLTAEPGIYIPKEGIGVRIEDDILITDDEPVVLSAKIPKTLV